MRHRVRTLLIIVLAAGMMGAMAQPGVAASRDRTPPIHLALGDSIPAGVGATDPDTTGYVNLLADILRRKADCATGHSWRAGWPRGGCESLELRNIAHGGETSASLITNQLPDALHLLRERNRNSNPHDDVRFITITIGGNDVFQPVVDACLLVPVPTCKDVIDKNLDALEVNLGIILRGLRAEAGRGTVIVATAYDNPIPSCDLRQIPGAVKLGNRVLEDNSIPGLNDRVRKVAKRYDVKVANVFEKLADDEFVGGPDCLHPNQEGHAVFARIFARTILN